MTEIDSGFNRDGFEPGKEAKIEEIKITAVSENSQTGIKLVSALLSGPGIGECFTQVDIFPDGHAEFATRRMATNLGRAGSPEEIGALIAKKLNEDKSEV